MVQIYKFKMTLEPHLSFSMYKKWLEKTSFIRKIKEFITIWQFCKGKTVKNWLVWGLRLKRQKLIGLGQTSNLGRI